jgi:hypothetical protein
MGSLEPHPTEPDGIPVELRDDRSGGRREW